MMKFIAYRLKLEIVGIDEDAAENEIFTIDSEREYSALGVLNALKAGRDKLKILNRDTSLNYKLFNVG